MSLPDSDPTPVQPGQLDLCLWDEYGTPRLPHVPCPTCGESDEISSHFDTAWCSMPGCAWRGSLTAMRVAALGFESISAGYEERPYTIGDRIAVVGVVFLCALALLGIVVSWLVSK